MDNTKPQNTIDLDSISDDEQSLEDKAIVAFNSDKRFKYNE